MSSGIHIKKGVRDVIKEKSCTESSNLSMPILTRKLRRLSVAANKGSYHPILKLIDQLELFVRYPTSAVEMNSFGLNAVIYGYER